MGDAGIAIVKFVASLVAALAAIFGAPYVWRFLTAQRQANRDAMALLIADYRDQVTALRKEMADANRAHAEETRALRAQVEEEKRERERVETELSNERAACARLRDEYEGLAREIAKLRDERNVLEAKMMARIRDLETTVRERDRIAGDTFSKAFEKVLERMDRREDDDV